MPEKIGEITIDQENIIFDQLSFSSFPKSKRIFSHIISFQFKNIFKNQRSLMPANSSESFSEKIDQKLHRICPQNDGRQGHQNDSCSFYGFEQRKKIQLKWEEIPLVEKVLMVINYSLEYEGIIKISPSFIESEQKYFELSCRLHVNYEESIQQNDYHAIKQQFQQKNKIAFSFLKLFVKKHTKYRKFSEEHCRKDWQKWVQKKQL